MLAQTLEYIGQVGGRLCLVHRWGPVACAGGKNQNLIGTVVSFH
jgi:hypothetical protein